MTEVASKSQPVNGRRKTIFRVPRRDRPYTIIANDALRDSRLPVDARGSLAFILSFPDDWQFHKTWLCKELKVGREKADRILRQLVKAGYCKRRRARNSDGTMGSWEEYIFTDEPGRLTEPQAENPSLVDEPQAAFPRAANQPLRRNDSSRIRFEDQKEEDSKVGVYTQRQSIRERRTVA